MNLQNSMCADVLTTGEASHELELSPDRIRQLERCGELPARRTRSGVRLFDRAVVEDFRRRREQKRSRQ